MMPFGRRLAAAAVLAACAAACRRGGTDAQGGLMDNRKLDALIRSSSEVLEGRPGAWGLRFNGEEFLVLSDEAHDRMRVMSPVAEEAALSDRDRRAVLAANFDRALDARYAVSGGKLWAVYLHPLGSLTETQFLDALEQTHRLKANYGTTYASSELTFQGGGASRAD
jgi:hypothetical protein